MNPLFFVRSIQYNKNIKLYKNDKRQKLVIYLKNADGIFGELKYNKESFQNFAKHSHKTFNIIAITEKNIDIKYHNQAIQSLSAEQIAIFNPYQVHLTSSKEASPLDYYSLHLQKSWCIEIQQEIFKNKEFIDISPNIIKDKTISKNFLEICKKILNEEEGDIEQELKTFSQELFSSYCQVATQIEPNQTLKKLEEYILKHLQEPLTLEKVAKEVGYSTAHINRLFKAEYGLTLHAFLIDKRIDKAKELIRVNKTATLTEIAYSAGFYDQSHFIKNFKKVYSLSPKAYK